MFSLRFLANAAMVLTAVIWGLSFVGQSNAMDTMEPMEFSAARFLLGALALSPFLLRRSARVGDSLRAGVILGLVLAMGAGLQQQALIYTTVGNASFITGLYTIFVPLLAIFLRRMPNRSTWFAALLSIMGLYFISIKGEFIIQKGDVLVVLCAIAFAAQILFVDHFTKHYPAITLAVIQFFACAFFCLGYSLVFENPSITHIMPTIGPILFTGLLSVGVAYTLQVIVQKYVNPTHAALILSMEAVVGWLAGIILLNEGVTIRSAFGCALMMCAMIIAIIANSDIEHEHPH